MIKEDLLKKIQETVPDGAEVVIFDYYKNLNDDSGEGSSAGIYTKFDVTMHTEQEIKAGCIPFASLTFTNEDYTEEQD